VLTRTLGAKRWRQADADGGCFSAPRCGGCRLLLGSSFARLHARSLRAMARAGHAIPLLPRRCAIRKLSLHAARGVRRAVALLPLAAVSLARDSLLATVTANAYRDTPSP